MVLIFLLKFFYNLWNILSDSEGTTKYSKWKPSPCFSSIPSQAIDTQPCLVSGTWGTFSSRYPVFQVSWLLEHRASKSSIEFLITGFLPSQSFLLNVKFMLSTKTHMMGWFWNLDHHPLITDPADFFLNRPKTHWRWTQRLGSQKRIRWVSPCRRAMLLHLNSLFASLNSNKDRSTWILHYRAFVAAARRKRDHSGSRCHRLFACCYSTGRHCCILEKKIY